MEVSPRRSCPIAQLGGRRLLFLRGASPSQGTLGFGGSYNRSGSDVRELAFLKRERLVLIREFLTGSDHERHRSKYASNIRVLSISEHVVMVDHPYDIPTGAPESARGQIRKQSIRLAAEPPCRIDTQARGLAVHVR